jgi:hypothetical protein
VGEDTRTGETAAYLYGVAQFGGLDFRCSVKPHPGKENHRELLKDMQKAAEQQNTVEMMRTLDKTFGPGFFTLHDCFLDWRQELAMAVSQGRLKIYSDFQRHVYEENRSLMKSLVRMGVRLPADLRSAVRRVLSLEAEQLVRDILRYERAHQGSDTSGGQTHYDIRSRVGRLQAVMQEARSWELRLVVTTAAKLLGEELVMALTALDSMFTSREAARLMRLMTICQDLDAKPELWLLQTLYHQLVQKALEEPALADLLFSQEGLLDQLDTFMRCRFKDLLKLE